MTGIIKTNDSLDHIRKMYVTLVTEAQCEIRVW